MQVFVDDFMNGLAGPAERKSMTAEETWVTRCSMHSIHGVFPPPEVIHHDGGKDSISSKKVEKGDAKFEPVKEMLGQTLSGAAGRKRTVGLSEDKYRKYSEAIDLALKSPAHRISMVAYQKVLGPVQQIPSFLLY